MGRTVQLKVNVTVEEYLAAKHVAEQYGCSVSWLGAKGLQLMIDRFHDANMDSDDFFINSPNRAMPGEKNES